MFFKSIKLILKFLLITYFLINSLRAEVINEIQVFGNNRISNETIEMFANISLKKNIDNFEINKILKNLYDSNFFEDVSVEFKNNVLKITVKENPIIQTVSFEGIKSNKIKNEIKKNLNLRNRSSFNENLLKKDEEIIRFVLKNIGYYFPKIDIYKESLDNNTINLKYNIDIGDKARIKKISFLGNKKFKDKKLKNVIVSEEYKFWKFLTGKKFLNENIITLDLRLLKNFYLNKGYYNVEIDTSFAKLLNSNYFEVIFNINANEKYYLNNIELNLPNDFNQDNFISLNKLFKSLKGEPYSINKVKNILEEIDNITIYEQYESISANVIENFEGNKINLLFQISQIDKSFVEKINIYGNNITRENVIRNQFEIDEGDPYNEILANKSVNNVKNLNFFRKVDSEIIQGSSPDLKIININVIEKATGEITAGAGVGTSGNTIAFGVKENNYLGKGIGLDTNFSISDESLKGLFSITNPNFKNTDKLVYFSAEALETDRLSAFGYKTNKTGYTIGTNFEFLDDFRLGIGNSNFYEKIETDSTASVRQRSQEGNYWDSFLNLNFDYDKRNQKFQTTDGFRSQYFVDVPLLSETATLTNTYLYKIFTELYDDNISSLSLFLSSSHSLKDENIKLSERIFLPSSRLRGFERGKIGPKDGDDFIGGNYAASLNLSSTIPQILQNSENMDFLVFMDVGNVWGVDYFDGDNEGSEVRSSIGLGLDWLTPIGPLNFTLATAITKAESDKTETFRFNLGTTF